MGSMHVFLLLAWFLVSMGTQLLPQLTRWQLMLEIVAWVASWYGLQVHSTKQHIRKECIIMSQVMQAIMLRSAGRKPWLQCKEKAWLCDKVLQQTSTLLDITESLPSDEALCCKLVDCRGIMRS